MSSTGVPRPDRRSRAFPVSYRLLASETPIVGVDTTALFAPARPVVKSPLDTFLTNTNTLNRIYLPYVGADWIPELGSLIVLGYMSAVESYVRAIITGLINVDPACRLRVADKQVSFALAAGGHDVRLLPEALLEHTAFSSESEIEGAIKNLLGFAKLSPDLSQALQEYRKLCQIRHCCVHRFGKLGSRNALTLGFEAHRRAIEHPFTPSIEQVQAMASTLQGVVKIINNFLFREALDRTARPDDPGGDWTWHYGRDRKRFSSYYDLFATRDSTPASPSQDAIYASFREARRRAAAGMARAR